MTDRLGEALARWDTTGTHGPCPHLLVDEAAILAAARSWHTLITSGDVDPERWQVVVDALTVTPTPEENPPQDFVND